MCAIFLSHFVFAVFWRTLVAFGFVFHHDWFCRLYVKMKIFPDIHLTRSKPVLSQQYEDSGDYKDVEIQISEFYLSFHLRFNKSDEEDIETLKNETNDVLKAIEETVDDLQKRHNAILKTLKITESLIAVNKKIVLQYIPLRTKVFVQGKSVTSQELQNLAQMVNQFNCYFVRE